MKMLSEQSKKLIDKKWPGIKDNKILLQNARRELLNFAYMISTPKDANDKFLARAIMKAKSLRFVAGGFVICAVLTCINDGINVGPFAALSGLLVELFVAIAIYWFYRNWMKLITCYKELMSESNKEEMGTEIGAEIKS